MKHGVMIHSLKAKSFSRKENNICRKKSTSAKSVLHKLGAIATACLAGVSGVAYGTDITGETRERMELNYVKSLVMPHSLMAHNLGFAWVGGNTNGNQFVGREMDVRYDATNRRWVIQGKPGPCTGFRCNERSSIYVSDIQGGQIGAGEIIGTPRIESYGNVIAISTWLINRSNRDQTGWVAGELTESSNWSSSLTETFGLSNATEKEVSIPLIGGVKNTLTVKYDKTTSSAKGQTTSVRAMNQPVGVVSPRSAMRVDILLRRSKASYEFKMPVELSAKIGYHGFLRWSGNAWHTKPTNRPTIHYEWVNHGSAKSDQNLRTQYSNAGIPGVYNPWDFNWMKQTYGDTAVRGLLNDVYKPANAILRGNFTSDNAVQGVIAFGDIVPISQVPPDLYLEDVEGTNGEVQIGTAKNFQNSSSKLKVSITPPPGVTPPPDVTPPNAKFPIKHISSKCVHPLGGSLSPANGTSAVFNDGCTEDRLMFTLTQQGSLKHIASGKCLHPAGGAPQGNTSNNERLVFWSGCDEPRLKFELTAGGSLRHAMSGKCIHPRGGSINPSSNTELVLHDGCDQDRLKFLLK